MNSYEKKGIASFLAVLFAIVMNVSHLQAGELVLLENSGAQLSLSLPEGTLPISDPSDLLAVFVGGDSCCDGRTPIAGRYGSAGDTLTFSPAFGFEPGQDYVARIRSAHAQEYVAFSLPADEESIPAAVTDLYPSGESLPENTLRFYIHFSVPMQPQVAFDYIRLINEAGEVDEAAFMRFRQELWNEDRTRLSVLIDPGRIKREVATNVELGPALLAGQQYTLAVEGGWLSADGTSTLSTFTRTFQVSEALRTRPDTGLWTVNAPCMRARDTLTVTFDRPFDRHLLTRALHVRNESGAPIDGEIEVAEAERSWHFTPLEPWTAENLILVASPVLEDVAGNNFRDLLDHVTGQQENDLTTTELLIQPRVCGG